MKTYILIFFGSGFGGITRYALGKLVALFWKHGFPLPTLFVNVLACFVLGFVAGKIQQKLAYSAEIQLLVVTGFCGGFSTFSTFSYESLKLWETQQYFQLFAYLLSSVLFCLFAVLTGLKLSQNL